MLMLEAPLIRSRGLSPSWSLCGTFCGSLVSDTVPFTVSPVLMTYFYRPISDSPMNAKFLNQEEKVMYVA